MGFGSGVGGLVWLWSGVGGLVRFWSGICRLVRLRSGIGRLVGLRSGVGRLVRHWGWSVRPGSWTVRLGSGRGVVRERCSSFRQGSHKIKGLVVRVRRADTSFSTTSTLG